LGTAFLGGGRAPDTDAAAVATVERAYDLGIRFLDTSPLYGPSERRVGEALRRRPYPGLALSTKAGTHPDRPYRYGATDMRWSVENSLNLLGRDSVDVVLIHDPPAIEQALASGDGFDALARLRDEGKLRWIGLGVRQHAFHHAAMDARKVDVILTYADFNVVNRSAAALIERAKGEGVGVILGSPQMLGLLAAGDPAESPRATSFPAADVRLAHEWWAWCRAHGVELRHLNLRFVLSHLAIDVVLSGGATPAEITQNVAEALTPIPPNVWDEALERIRQLDKGSSWQPGAP
ncbi:MAG: aldo/keto reductase, partial [Actinobacteria bacterium]|nr:aldo/keto reductase [Actinomycetota bacterium]